jgi:Transposase DDE domain
LQRALDQAVPPRRRQEIGQQSGYDGQAQQLTVEPYWRALLVRQIVGGSWPDLPHGMARDPLDEAPGARLEIAVPALSKANAQRPSPAFGDVLAEVRAAVEARPQAVRLGRTQPLGAATPKALRESGPGLERTQIFDAPTLAWPPQIARWARPSAKRERAGSKVPLRLRAGYGGIERVMGTGAKGTDNPSFGALVDRQSAAPGQVDWFDTGYGKLATYDALREHGRDWVTLLPASISVEVREERPGPRSATAQGDTLPRERRVRLGTGTPPSPSLWRLIDATDTHGHRRTILTSLLTESAERVTQVRAYRGTLASVFRWLKRVLQWDTLIRVSPAGLAMQVAVAVIVYGVLLL